MGIKVARITFPDNTIMYAVYSTVSDSLASELIAVTLEQKSFIEHPETIPGDSYDTDVLQGAILGMPPISSALHEQPEEIVQCEVLLYPATAWASKAKRLGNVGIVTGPDHGQEYCGDWEEDAQKTNRLMSGLGTVGPNHSKPWWRIWQ